MVPSEARRTRCSPHSRRSATRPPVRTGEAGCLRPLRQYLDALDRAPDRDRACGGADWPHGLAPVLCGGEDRQDAAHGERSARQE